MIIDGTRDTKPTFLYDLWQPSYMHPVYHRISPKLWACRVFCSEYTHPGDLYLAAVLYASIDYTTHPALCPSYTRPSFLAQALFTISVRKLAVTKWPSTWTERKRHTEDTLPGVLHGNMRKKAKTHIVEQLSRKNYRV